MCIYGLLSFVISSFEEESLQVYHQKPDFCMFVYFGVDCDPVVIGFLTD